MAQEAARAYWRFTVLWLVAGSALGVLSALSLLAPEFLSAHPVFGFGRLVAAHRAVMIHGALFAGVFASAYTLLPRLTQAPAVSGRSGWLLAWVGAAIVLAGVVSIMGGQGSGREYADLPSTLAFIFWLYLICVALDLSALLARSRAIAPGPSSGFLLMASILPAVVYPFALPGWWGTGLFEAVRTWISWRAIFMLSFTAAGLGVGLWYLGAKGSRFRLDRGAFVIGAGLLVCLGPMMGVVHLLDAPILPGLKAVGALAGVLVAVGLVILVGAMWRGYVWDPPGLLILGGLGGIAAASVQGVVMVIPPLHSAFHFTSNTSGHAHLALGAVILMMLGGAIAAAPRISRRRLVLAERAYAAAGWFIVGLLVVFLTQTAAGVLQAAAFTKGLSVPDWLPTFCWLQLGSILGGLGVLVGSVIFARMVVCTVNAPSPRPALSATVAAGPGDAIEGGEG